MLADSDGLTATTSSETVGNTRLENNLTLFSKATTGMFYHTKILFQDVCTYVYKGIYIDKNIFKNYTAISFTSLQKQKLLQCLSIE